MGELAVLTLIGALTLGAQWLAWLTRAPSIVFLLAAGIVVGPVLGLVDADALLGDLLFPVVSLSVAVILFEGSLTLRFHELKDTGSTLWRMLTIGVLVTWVIIACAVKGLLDVDWPLAVLFGAIMVVTGPTVIGPMLQSVRPNKKISRLLRWEGIVIDPVGAVLAILVFNTMVVPPAGQLISTTLLHLGEILLVGGIGGAVAGYGLGLVLRNYWLPEYLHNVGTLLFVLIVFTLTDSLAHESGLLAVTIMGIWLANMPGVRVDDILDFKESLSVLLISALFILLASRLDLGALGAIAWPALGVFLIVQFVARPLKIAVSTLSSDLTWKERGLLAWIAPRGIVAAAISALFALRLEEVNYPGFDIIVPLAFALIIGTVVWQGLTAPFIARRLGVAQPEATGVLFVGGSIVALSLAKRLNEAGFSVMVADSSWENISKARMAGVPTYFGNPVSEDAERKLDKTGIGRLFAVSQRNELNALACLRYAHDFGRNAVYSLATTVSDGTADKHSLASDQRGQRLFGSQYSYAKLASLLSKGADLRQTRLTGEYSLQDLLAAEPSGIPLFAWDTNKILMVATDIGEFQPAAGWTVLTLVPVAPLKRGEE